MLQLLGGACGRGGPGGEPRTEQAVWGLSSTQAGCAVQLQVQPALLPVGNQESRLTLPMCVPTALCVCPPLCQHGGGWGSQPAGLPYCRKGLARGGYSGGDGSDLWLSPTGCT